MGLGRSAATVVLALALLGPGPFVSPSPGGDGGSRSTPAPPTLLMVNVNETTCLCPAPVGGVFTGTAGGGIARWTEDGTLATLHTMADGGIATNHIVDIAPDIGTCLAIGDTEEPLVYATGAIGDRWFTQGKVEGAKGPLRALEGSDGGFLVLDASGAIYLSDTGASWSRLDPKYGLRTTGWEVADRDGDILAVSNGTDVVLVDLNSINHWTKTSPSVLDIDIDGDKVAIASPDHPDVYDIATDSWLDENGTQAIMGYGQGWSMVRMGGNKFTSANLEGLVIEANITINNSGGLKLQGTISDKTDANVTDMLLLANHTVLLSTMKGNWVLKDGEASPFPTSELSMPPSNDILSVSYEADTLWVLTPEGLASLSFDSRGFPTAWTQGPYLGEGVSTGMLDTAYLEGTVYICGYGPGVHTYDTFASSAPSRWGRVHIYGDARDDVEDVAVVNGTLYAAGEFGMDKMVPGSDPPAFEMVEGSPVGALCLYTEEDSLYSLYIGTREGLWWHDTTHGIWIEPEYVHLGLRRGPVSDYVRSGYRYYAAIGDEVHTDIAPPGDHNENVSFAGNVTRLVARPDVEDPVWAVAGGGAFTLVWEEFPGPDGPIEMMVAKERERERLGDAWVNDAALSTDGTLYLATDSGLQTIDRFGTSWYQWTTSNGLSANDIRTLSFVEQTVTLWVGAYGGVDVMDVHTEVPTRIGVEEGIPSNLVYDITMEGTDVWVGTDVGGAARADRGKLEWQVYNTSSGLIADDVQAVAVRGDLVLFGTDEGVTVLDRGDSTIESYTSSSSGLPGDWVWCALSHETGIYVGTDMGLALFVPDTGEWQAFDIEGISGTDVRSLEMTTRGDLWVGTNDGLFVLPRGPGMIPDTHGVLELGRSEGLPGEEVLSLRLASDDRMWVGTSAGVAIVYGLGGYPTRDPGVQATFTTEDGLVHDRVTAIEEGPEGTMWLGTAGGLSRLTKTEYRIRPQWTTPKVDVPDVYVTLDDIIIEPEVPNEGDEVQVRATVSNPSGKRAIVHIGLFGDLEGAPGDEISSDIAYTEPGSSYQVTLAWTAVGGEHNLWVVVDPEDLVPESNERNNVVAVSIHVNFIPEILDLTVLNITEVNPFPEQLVRVDFTFTYRDRDADPEVTLSVRSSGQSGSTSFLTPMGTISEGAIVMGRIEVPLGNTTLTVFASDGRAEVNTSFDVEVNFLVTVEGLERGRNADGDMRFTVTPGTPWEGSSIQFVEVALVEPGRDPYDSWDASLFHSTTRDGEEYVYDAAREKTGKYDVWVLVTDNRYFMALHVEHDVEIEPVESDDGWMWYVWATVALAIVSVVVLLVASLKRRSS